MSNHEELPLKTKLELIVNAGMSAIPYIGGSLAALYFGKKQEERFHRLERFYAELRDELATKMNEITPLENHDPGALTEIIEEINEAVQTDYTDQKRDYFKKCFINALRESNQGKSDKRRSFVSTLRALTNLQIEILSALLNADAGSVCRFMRAEEEGAADFNASLEDLRSRGLLYSHLGGTLIPDVNWGEISFYRLSPFGREFSNFCLTDSLRGDV